MIAGPQNQPHHPLSIHALPWEMLVSGACVMTSVPKVYGNICRVLGQWGFGASGHLKVKLSLIKNKPWIIQDREFCGQLPRSANLEETGTKFELNFWLDDQVCVFAEGRSNSSTNVQIKWNVVSWSTSHLCRPFGLFLRWKLQKYHSPRMEGESAGSTVRCFSVVPPTTKVFCRQRMISIICGSKLVHSQRIANEQRDNLVETSFVWDILKHFYCLSPLYGSISGSDIKSDGTSLAIYKLLLVQSKLIQRTCRSLWT